MELIKQEKLHYIDAKSDKVYEVELYYIQDNEYVVNFRYGRRGKTLKEGTKTVFPVPKEQAEKLYEDLVASKTKKGYQQVQSYDDAITQPAPIPLDSYEASGAREIVLSYLNKRSKGEILTTNWKLSRIIWRAGELEIEEALEAIKDLLPDLQGQEIYSTVWYLGRIANSAAHEILNTIPLDPQSLHYNIHVGALINCGNQSQIDAVVNLLPSSWKSTYATKSYELLKTELVELLSLKSTNAAYLLTLYYLSIHDIKLKKIILEALNKVELIPGKWKYIRYIYKIAEMIKDGETFGLIARLVNLKSSYYKKNRWSDNVWIDGKSVNVKEALSSNNSPLAFSKSTKDYFVKRTLRRLRKAGVDKMESYCELASGILLSYSDEDSREESKMNLYHYDRESRTYITVTHTFPAMANVPYFYYILFAQGNRMEIPAKLNRFFIKSGAGEWTSREDSFSKLWDRFPQYAVKILAHCRQKDVMNFGFKVLEGRDDLESLLTLDKLMSMISSRFQEVLEFSLSYIEKKYDPLNPKLELVFKLVKTGNEKAINLAIELLNKNTNPFIKNVEFIKSAILSTQISLHEWIRKTIQEDHLNEREISSIVDHCLNVFKTWEEETRNMISAETLVQVFPVFLKKLDAQKIIELIDDQQLQVQLFGAKLINLNERKPEQWPDNVLLKLLTSEHSSIRDEGMKLFSSLSDNQLLKKGEFIIQLASSEHQDLRLQVRPVIGRLVTQNKLFAEEVLNGLFAALLETHTDEELAVDVYGTIESHLLPFTSSLKDNLEEMLLSNNREVHILTNHMLESENINEWPVEKIAKLGAHDMNTIRKKVHKYFEENIGKVKYEKYEAINILDTDWEETRRFARDYFGKHFTEKEWEPDLVIALCDNVRPETQEYGTRVLGHFFKEEHGSKYLLAFSEHPDPIIELYSTNYLNQYAFNNQTMLDKLKSYFIRTLSSINTRRVAKLRVFHFLQKQAKESESSAEYVANILNELVGTIAIQENEKYVGLLHELKQKHPNLHTKVEFVPLEIR